MAPSGVQVENISEKTFLGTGVNSTFVMASPAKGVKLKVGASE